MCKYCSGEKSLRCTRGRLSSKGDFAPGIEVFVERGMLYITAVADVYEPNYMEEEIEINYCPKCGRDLKETGEA